MAEKAEKAPKAEKKPKQEYTRYQKFTTVLVPRTEILEAPYNPRFIGELERQRLLEKIASLGLANVLVWNKRTRHLVSGHQRLDILDELEAKDGNGKNFEVEVAQIDVDESKEKQIVLFFNNRSAQGNWSFDGLADMLRDIGLEGMERGGFDQGAMKSAFKDVVPEMFPEAENFFKKDKQKPAPAAMPTASYSDAREDTDSDEEDGDDSQAGGASTFTSEGEGNYDTDVQRSEIIGQVSSPSSPKQPQVSSDEQSGHFTVMVFQSRVQADEFLEIFEMPNDSRYVDGLKLANAMEVEMPF